ncbi:TIGR04282 family arsenosugar biosynthesis glycosyltransferase [bacterium]|nr:TIGR04282 family arsenosugar biosynthesis glycosyltransferase [bacterium]
MARQPTPGAVKTRLARRIGDAAACVLYRAFLTDLAASVRRDAWRTVWAVTPAGADLRSIVGDAEQIAQRGDDLASRMRHAFADLFGRGASRVVMIGADAPHLGADAIAAAFAALDAADVVLTPTRDGGYCLIGLCAAHDLFLGVDMGTDRVFQQTVDRAAADGLRLGVQPPAFDVDEWEDVLVLRRLLDSGAVTLPATAAALATIGRG